LAAGANNGVIGQVVFWDIEMAKVVGRLPELGANIAALRFAPDGKTLAVRDAQQGTTTLFDKATGQVVRQLNGRGPYATQTDVFSPDNKLLATASGDTVCVEEPATGKEVRRLKQAVAGISALAFSPDGKVLATGTATHLIRLWDLATGKEVLPLGGHQGPVHQLAYSPDDKLLATSSIDRIVRLWDSATGKEVRQLTRPMPADEPVQAWAAQMAFARDGKTLAAIWHDGWLGRWDVATGKLLNQFEGSGPPPACSAFSPDGRWLAWLGHDGVVRLRDVATGKEVRNFPANPPAPAPGQAAGNRVSTLAFSPDGRTLLAGYHVAQQLVPDLGRGFGTGLAPVPSGPLQVPVCLWEVAAGKLRQQFDLSMPAGSSGHPGGLLLEGQGKIRFDFQFLPGGGSVTGAWFAPDGRSVALGTGTTIYVYDLLKGKISRQFEAGLTSGQALALSPDGKYLATAGMDGTVGLSEVASGRDLGPLRGHLGQLSCVAFSPDGKSLASAGTDTTVLIWDLAALREAGQRRPHLAPDQLAVLWKQLAEEDAAQAYLAVRALQAAPESVVPYLRERLKPVPTVDTRRIAQLIADLDSDSFDVRKQATAELEKVGELAETALEQVLAGQPSLEVRQRAEALLDRLRMAVTSPEQLRQLRAVEVLEQTSTPEARGLLEKLAEGAPEARLTRDAQESLARLVRGN
jgi:WD40 repeat protein